MKLLAIKIKPLSSFATLPKGDTIFGQIVAYDFLEKKSNFANYLDKPNLIVSDMMPLGYVYRPNLPLDCFSTDNQDVNKKELRKKEFISIQDLQNGNLHKCEKIDFMQNFQVVKNSINRVSFTTDGDDFAPYSNIEQSYFQKLWMFILVDETLETRVIELLKKVGHFGFGKEANIGKGVFEIELIENPIKDIETNYYMSISPTILQNQEFLNVFYEPFTRFGKFGLNNSNENVFKKPVLMANSASVVKTDKKISYFGKSLNNGFENRPSFIQGCSIALPITIKDEKCLS